MGEGPAIRRKCVFANQRLQGDVAGVSDQRGVHAGRQAGGCTADRLHDDRRVILGSLLPLQQDLLRDPARARPCRRYRSHPGERERHEPGFQGGRDRPVGGAPLALSLFNDSSPRGRKSS